MIDYTMEPNFLYILYSLFQSPPMSSIYATFISFKELSFYRSTTYNSATVFTSKMGFKTWYVNRIKMSLIICNIFPSMMPILLFLHNDSQCAYTQGFQAPSHSQVSEHGPST